MFEIYENNNYHLDFWESCDNGTADIHRSLNIRPVSIKEVLSIMNSKSYFLDEGVEVDGKVYDNLEDVYHVGSYVEFVKSVKQLSKLVNPENIRKSYPNEKDYPVDFFTQFLDPVTLKRVGLWIAYKSIPFENGRYDKKVGKITVFKAKAFAARKQGATWKFDFMINNKSDIAKVKKDPDLKISWTFEPRKALEDLSPRAIQQNVLGVASKLTTYKVVGDDFAEVVEDIVNAAR